MTEKGKETQDGQVAPEVTETQVQKEVADTQKTISELQAKLDAAEKSTKGQQRTAEKYRLQLERTQGLRDEVTELKKTLNDALLPMLSDMYDRSAEDAEPVKQRPSQQYLSRIQAKEQKEEPKDAPEVEEALELAESAGMSIVDDDELAPAYKYFAEGKNSKGLDFVKKIVATKAEKPEEKKVEYTQEDKERIAREWAEEQGLNIIETNKPQGGNKKEISVETLEDPEWRKETSKEDRWKAMLEGKIKGAKHVGATNVSSPEE